MKSAALSPIIMVGALVFPDMTCLITDASATLKPFIPLTLYKKKKQNKWTMIFLFDCHALYVVHIKIFQISFSYNHYIHSRSDYQIIRLSLVHIQNKTFIIKQVWDGYLNAAVFTILIAR